MEYDNDERSSDPFKRIADGDDVALPENASNFSSGDV
jgi:hypothetical protein